VAVMDWHSRKILSWRVSNTLDSDFCDSACNIDPPLAVIGIQN
jgi:hypothetical protein